MGYRPWVTNSERQLRDSAQHTLSYKPDFDFQKNVFFKLEHVAYVNDYYI